MNYILNKQILIILMILFVISLSCENKGKFLKGHDYSKLNFFEQCREYEFNIDSLPYDELPNTNYSITSINDTNFIKDSAGVPLLKYEGGLFYHPVYICHKTLAYLDYYNRTLDTNFLNKIITNVDRIIIEGHLIDSAMYFPYLYDYKVHRIDDAQLEAPWYSGMAQGEILGLLVRTYLATQNQKYFDYAHQTFISLTRLKGESNPWVVFEDERGCFWIEEYPTQEPSKTLNGFIYAVYGLYDYYQLTKDNKAKELLLKCFNTIKNYIPYFRRKNKPSFYNLTYRHYAHNYHFVHIKQLRFLEKMTNDSFFGAYADTLEMDFDRETEKEYLSKLNDI